MARRLITSSVAFYVAFLLCLFIIMSYLWNPLYWRCASQSVGVGNPRSLLAVRHFFLHLASFPSFDWLHHICSHHPPPCCTQHHQLVSSNPAVSMAKSFEFPDAFAQSFVRDECWCEHFVELHTHTHTRTTFMFAGVNFLWSCNQNALCHVKDYQEVKTRRVVCSDNFYFYFWGGGVQECLLCNSVYLLILLALQHLCISCATHF